ncbi:MAG: hypothetical protein ABL866_15270 [Devosia sp.]
MNQPAQIEQEANKRIQEIAQASQNRLNVLNSKISSAQRSGNIGLMTQMQNEAAAILDENTAQANAINQAARAAYEDNRRQLLRADISFAGWAFLILADPSPLMQQWSGLYSFPIRLQSAGEGKYLVAALANDGTPQYRLDQNGNAIVFTAEQVVAAYLLEANELLAIIGIASCDPSYSVACVPIALDVDCLGGTGDGPAYPDRRGPFPRVGPDLYGLDRDKDGRACEENDDF